MKILNHVIEVTFNARCPITHMKLHKRPYYNHFVWGKLSVIFGQPHLQPVRVCAHCHEEIHVLNAGDEYWDYCENCHLTEGEIIEITMEEYEGRS